MKPYPAAGDLLAAAVLRQQGHEVHLFDAMLSEGERRVRAVSLEELRPGWSGSSRTTSTS